MAHNSFVRKIVAAANKYSWICYLVGYLYIFFLNSGFGYEEMVIDKGALRTNFEDLYDIPRHFDDFENKILKSSTSDFIKKAFTYLNLQITEIKIDKSKIIHGLLRAPKSDQKESILIVFKYDENKSKCVSEITFSASSLILNLIQHISRQKWMSKDLLFVAIPKLNSVKEETILTRKWINKYYSKTNLTEQNKNIFKKGGKILAALVLDIPCTFEPRSFHLLTGSKLGTLPNMDIFSFISKHFRLRDIPLATFETINFFESDSFLTNFYNFVFEKSNWKIKDIFDNFWNMLKFVIYQAGSFDKLNDVDSALLEKGIDSVTLKSLPLKTKTINFLNDKNSKRRHLFNVLLNFVRSFSNVHEKLHHSLYMYIVLSPFKIIRFSLSEFSLLFFLFPNFIFIVETYLERKSSPENATNFYLFFNIIFCCILMWLLPFIFHPISLNTNLIIAVNFALLLICFYVCYKIFSKKVNLDVTNSLFTLFFTLNVICLSYINFSLALVNSIAITPFLSISRTKTSTCKKFVLFVYLFFLSNFFFGVLYSVSNEKSQFGKMWEDLLKGYLDVTTFRNINYFCFFVHFFPSLFLLLFRINFRCKFGKDKKD